MKIALIGFGTVGQGLCEILRDKKNSLNQKYNFEGKVVAVSDVMKGSVYCPDGLNIDKLLEFAQNGKSLNEYDCNCENKKLETGWDALKTIKESNADVICELAYTDLQTGEPAISHCKAAFESGKHVVTSNKGPAALAYQEMAELAKANNVQFKIEGTVVSGTPILNLAEGPLAGCKISAVKGILNGTTNYILSEMENGMGYEDALAKAQELGYAEADPTGDVEGYDARAKVAILTNVVMGQSFGINDVSCEGITKITSEDIAKAKTNNTRWKLLGSTEIIDGKVIASVKPEPVPLSHPLAGIMGAANALTFSTDLMGDVTIVGAGAGKIETGFSILTDLLAINSRTTN